MLTVGAEIAKGQSDTDTLRAVPGDSLYLDGASTDTLRTSEAVLQDPVNYSATDSILNDLTKKQVLLFGDAVVSYRDITLKADRIVYDFSTYTVHAHGVQDTSGAWVGEPVFTQGGTTFDAHEMDYNFKSKKAYVKQVETEVIEGVLTGERVKTTQDNKVIYIRHGEYCPCEDPNAKTRFKIGRLKVIKDDRIVTGPGYLALGKIPTPLAFPFGFFPNTEDKQAGLIIPSYGNGQKQGYFLNDLGFYMPFGDNFDTKFLTDIYSRGSWGLSNETGYKKRYKFTGDARIDYNVSKFGDPDLNNDSENRTFFVSWSHKQDRSARPNSNFSADVNAGSTQNFTNNLNSSQEDYLTNTFRSNIRYDKSFYNSPWSLSLSAGHDQNSLTRTFNFTLPTLSVNKARTFPFADLFGKTTGGKQAFYEKIGWTYSANFQNKLSAQEDELRLDNWQGLKRKFRNGVRHQTALSTSLKAGAVSINPNISYTERWYFRTYGRRLDPETQEVVRDTLNGFDRSGNWSAGVSTTTKLYGMYSFKGKGLKAIRHTVTPSLSYTYRPDFDPRVFGFYDGDGDLKPYSPYDGTLYGGPPSGESQTLSFRIANNLEAKVLSRRDTTSKFKKVPILDNLSLSGNYNLAADSMGLSPISISARTGIGKFANINAGSTFQPYAYVVNHNDGDPFVQMVDRYEYNRSGRLANFERANVSVDITGLSNSLFDRGKPAPEATIGTATEQDGTDEFSGNQQTEDKRTWSNLFEDFSLPWSVNVRYVMSVRNNRLPVALPEGYAIRDSLAYTQSARLSGGFTLFDIARISFDSGYDFQLKELTPTTLRLELDLNCWVFNASVVPFGEHRSYRLSLNIKASILQDLKLERNRSFAGNEKFFQ